MKLVIQRVSSAFVQCTDHFDEIGKGLCVLFCAVEGDACQQAELLARKTCALRIFSDSEGKMNLSVMDIGGEILTVPNFTLAADTKKGNRPSFIASAAPALANDLFEHYKKTMTEIGVPIKTGVFGDDMKVSIINDGPITIVMDTESWKK